LNYTYSIHNERTKPAASCEVPQPHFTNFGTIGREIKSNQTPKAPYTNAYRHIIPEITWVFMIEPMIKI
jgi:hypothetical protein